jgi:hypothetical protein
MNWNKFLLYSGVIEVIVGLLIFLFYSRLVGIIILLVGLVDLGIVFFWPSLFDRSSPDNKEE